MSSSEFDLRIRRLYNEAVRDRDRLREAGVRVGMYYFGLSRQTATGLLDRELSDLNAAVERDAG